jgi:hypothetical protein
MLSILDLDSSDPDLYTLPMNRDDYIRLHSKINARYEESLKLAFDRIKAKLDAERRKDLESLKRTWTLDNSTPPPEIDVNSPSNAVNNEIRANQADNTHNSRPLRSRNDKIRRAVQLIEGDEVTQPIVMKKLEEEFPEAAKGLAPTLISKVLRWLEDHGALITVSMGSARKPRVYRKTELINRF